MKRRFYLDIFDSAALGEELLDVRRGEVPRQVHHVDFPPFLPDLLLLHRRRRRLRLHGDILDRGAPEEAATGPPLGGEREGREEGGRPGNREAGRGTKGNEGFNGADGGRRRFSSCKGEGAEGERRRLRCRCRCRHPTENRENRRATRMKYRLVRGRLTKSPLN